MYDIVLLVHSWLRWFVIFFALLAIIRAIHGAATRRPWLPADDLAGKLFIRSLDLQILLGLLLYFVLSPITKGALADFTGAMQVSATRFWAVEHVFGVIVGVALAHRGHSRLRQVQDAGRRHKATIIFYSLALVAILVSIPWPGTPNARPLIRW